MSQPSPLAPEKFPNLPAVPGVEISGLHVGLKPTKGVKDLMMARLARGTTIAGVFTQSKCPSAPVDWCRSVIGQGSARALIVNSGNANAFTGNAGDIVVSETVRAAAKLLKCPKREVFVASTGVIGVPVPPDYIAGKLPRMVKALKPKPWLNAAESIMTTDTFPKGAARKVRIGDAEVSLVGVTKGSGMIAPDMATMLCFVFTDAKIPARVLQTAIKAAANKSYNCITVDSDTSTSDTVLMCATGKGARHEPVVTATDSHFREFRRALDDLMIDLATQVVRDGEGAQKLITIDVTGAQSAQSAKRIGLSIANSPLVKTAVAGEDANWGRIVMAVGKAGEPADRDRLSISMGGVPITENGIVREDYVEAPVAEHMKGQAIHIGVDIGLGRGKARVWTCDLTHGYITINADYRS
ncbi:MAG: bifunctional glutamate N-acetyltransferase/amino-acid acetyltransferase ArgJ [Rhodospirillaceae bacterium]|jgi:glutamate N-acetyltransferase / amino-acid N-acetyltransferase|nr:bifunctional glutamate N-acetyltransferase/amino-acid acetyltransferase ArgJ [Rhodospirillaceae bacterium]MBT5667253.1 bifunctional glutamate N-acetyltransferase/amino-acid acetyltransferase ArgJ [Rhodospirillaceae bacterium]